MAWIRLPLNVRNAVTDTLVDMIDLGSGAGTIKIYSGTPPASANDAVTSQVLLATLPFSDPAFGAAASGTATANTITQDSYADATGTATWARIADSAGNTVFDCDVGTVGATINLNTTSIVEGAAVRITSGSITMPAGT